VGNKHDKASLNLWFFIASYRAKKYRDVEKKQMHGLFVKQVLKKKKKIANG
jgi:hypothetical protein